MTKENLTKLFSFKTLYLALLAFVILHLILLVFGLSFTPILWNSWFFILCLTFLIHPWRIFYRTRDFQWYHLIFQLFSGLVALYLWFAAFFALSIMSDPVIPINIDYRIQDKEIIIVRGFVVHSTYEHHELINPFIMKSEVEYNEDTF
ncbi:hypothetical protein SORDD30_00502 [Streptococcus oralis]|uniref:Uncharacterized protein n=1 Tax=Streptococcus oralis TaxID=1303 RepID=A0A139QAF8_STROR|nr:hypothetical protein [Streptococcus oralis]KXT99545.1 hypothetical protein SORDD30_00502 [Streptococcus oralis]